MYDKCVLRFASLGAVKLCDIYEPLNGRIL